VSDVASYVHVFSVHVRTLVRIWRRMFMECDIWSGLVNLLVVVPIQIWKYVALTNLSSLKRQESACHHMDWKLTNCWKHEDHIYLE